MLDFTAALAMLALIWPLLAVVALLGNGRRGVR